MAWPTGCEPVKLRAATVGLVASSLPTTRPSPTTTLSTPLGKPASVRARASSNVMAGAWLAGFMTTVLPQTSAGASFQAGMAMGKFQGVIRATTPTGSRRV
jgi:hypothetical protein